MEQFVQGYSNFSADFFQRAFSEVDSSLVVSPINIFATFMVLYMGARQRTAEEFQSTFRIPGVEASQAATFLRDFEHVVPADFKESNKVYVRQGLTPKFTGLFQTLDFTREQEAVAHINSEVEKATNGKIKDIVNRIEPDTAMLIISTIYFKGLWEEHFEKLATRPQPFWISNTESVDVDTMQNGNSAFGHAHLEDLGVQLLEMPYKESSVSFLIVLPDKRDGLNGIVSKLPTIQVDILSAKLDVQDIDVKLPKFKFENELKLNKVLIDMGLTRAFTDYAEFDLVEEKLPLKIKISEAIHKTFIEVNEVGTEAAAATNIRLIFHTLSIPPRFYVDHPFLFYIIDRIKRVPVFVGAVRKF